MPSALVTYHSVCLPLFAMWATSCQLWWLDKDLHADLVRSHSWGGQGWSHGWEGDLLILRMHNLGCICAFFEVTLYLIVDLTKVSTAVSPRQNALSSISVKYVFMFIRHATCDNRDVLDISAILAWNTPSNKPGFALRQDVLPMLCVNFVWPLSTKNVPMSCGSGCRYENVRLQLAVMYTRGEGEGSACGWWPAEAPDVQRCLGLVLCCKCVVRSRLPDTHWGIWAADDGSLFPACKINCRLLRNMKMLTKRNPWLVRKEDVRVKKTYSWTIMWEN